MKVGNNSGFRFESDTFISGFGLTCVMHNPKANQQLCAFNDDTDGKVHGYYNSTSGELELYVDGSLEQSASATLASSQWHILQFGVTAAGEVTLRLGNTTLTHNLSGSASLNGEIHLIARNNDTWIDDLVIYDNDNSNGLGHIGIPPPCRFYFVTDADEFTLANDSSATGFTAEGAASVYDAMRDYSDSSLIKAAVPGSKAGYDLPPHSEIPDHSDLEDRIVSITAVAKNIQAYQARQVAMELSDGSNSQDLEFVAPFLEGYRGKTFMYDHTGSAEYSLSDFDSLKARIHLKT